MDDFSDRAALVTGASSGIGRAVALALGRRGMRLAIAARRQAALDALADEITVAGGCRPAVLATDLSHPGAAVSLAYRALDLCGGVDVLVNNAATMTPAMQCGAGDGADARALFETNYWSPLAIAAAVVPGMHERGRGTIVNISSASAVIPLRQLGYYAASKAALSAATEAMEVETRGSNVHVIHVVLGGVRTDLLSQATRSSGSERIARWAPTRGPDEAAERIVRALTRHRCRVVYPRAMTALLAFPTITRAMARLTGAATTT